MPTHAKYWNKVAEKYASRPVADEAAYQRKLSATRSYLTPEMRILEFGCGSGATAVHHAPHVQHIDAIDISENMLQIGRGKATQAGVDNITFSCGTLAEFGADDASYDCVLGLNILHLLPDWQATISEVVRILKPGGFFVSSTVCLGNSPLRMIKIAVPLGKLFGLMPDLFIITEQQLTSEIADAGFTIERHWHHAKRGIAVFIIARKN